MQHSSDEEQQEISKKLNSMSMEERKAKAAAISTSWVLTQEDFQKIFMVQMRKELDAAPGKSQKRKYIERDSDEEPRCELLSPRDHWTPSLKAKVWQRDKTSNCNGWKDRPKRICEEENQNESIFQFDK